MTPSFSYHYPHPAVTVDVVVLSRTGEVARVLLVRRARALIPEGRPTLTASSDAAEANWFDVTRLPPLAFDHSEIIATALRTL